MVDLSFQIVDFSFKIVDSSFKNVEFRFRTVDFNYARIASTTASLPPPKFGSAGSPRVACPTSVPERLELYGEARPKPPTLRRRAEKHQKSFRRVGESFLAGIRVAHKRLQEQKAPPRLEGT